MLGRFKFVLFSTVLVIINILAWKGLNILEKKFIITMSTSSLFFVLMIVISVISVIIILGTVCNYPFDEYTINPKSVIVSYYMKTKGEIAIDVDGEFFIVDKKSKMFYQINCDNKDDIQIRVKKNFWGNTISKELFIEGRLQDYKVPE